MATTAGKTTGRTGAFPGPHLDPIQEEDTTKVPESAHDSRVPNLNEEEAEATKATETVISSHFH